jgi:uncharacterized phage protein gp47/JayE
MGSVPAVDYTNKDFGSLRQALLDLARYRLPEWTDRSSADLGVLLVELFAYLGDIVLYYQDRIASESFLHTASERHSVLHLLRLIGYELKPAVASTANLALTFSAPVQGGPTTTTVPNGAQFATKGSNGAVQFFEYLGLDLNIDLKGSQVVPSSDGKMVTYNPIPVRNSKTLGFETLGSSTGEPNQSFALSNGPLIPESLDVQVDEGAGPIPWTRRENLLYYIDANGKVTLSSSDSRDYYVQFDEKQTAWVTFGDGVYGMLPPVGNNNIRARYRIGGGTAGNVPAGAITEMKTQIPLLKSVTNPNQAVGGDDPETIDHAVQFGPLAFRSGQRAVTLSDFISLSHQVGGVAKVQARSPGWNKIELYIAPEGPALSPTPDDLKRRLIAYFEDKRMIGTSITIKDPKPVSIDVSVDLVSEHNYDPESVRQKAIASLKNLLAYENVEFNIPIYLSKVYEAVENIQGVRAATVNRFRREDQSGTLLDQIGMIPDNFKFLPASVRRALQAEIAPEGRIDIGEFELPQMGTLLVTIQEVSR